jgi:osmotically-inducible protein OsmY
LLHFDAQSANRNDDMKAKSTIGLLLMITLASCFVLVGSEGIAQKAAPALQRLDTAVETPPTHVTISTADRQLQLEVENALRSDPYFYDAHVIVSVKNGTVILEGFVFSDWDLRDAIRIAAKAAGGGRVVDNLTIEVGGRK